MSRFLTIKRNARPGHTPAGFTLVELLVVITIIAILAGLLTAAAVGAMRRARMARIKVEVDQIAMAFDTYAQEVAGGEYPPNAISDGSNNFNANTYNGTVRNDFLRHFKRAFPNSREPEALIEALIGVNRTSTAAPVGPIVSNNGGALVGGLRADEALVFWLGGFSSDPKYPISGVGGPSYLLDASGGLGPNAQDPIEERNWIMPLQITQLQPRNDQGYFNDDQGRFLVYPDPRTNGAAQRRINFWWYTPPNSTVATLYFDASRHSPVETNYIYDPPLDGFAGNSIFAIKVPATTSSTPTFKFANDGKIQILHAGIDDDWGDFTQIRLDQDNNGTISPQEALSALTYPTGPFTGALSDTIINFSPSTLEDSQP